MTPRVAILSVSILFCVLYIIRQKKIYLFRKIGVLYGSLNLKNYSLGNESVSTPNQHMHRGLLALKKICSPP